MKKIHVILYPGCIPFEVALAAELLSKNFQIINISPDGKDLFDLPGLPLKVNGSYSSVSLNECAGILVPGGNPGSIISNKDISDLLKNANSQNIIIGAICAGPSVLGKAGILVGKKIAHGYNSEQLEFLKNIFKGVEVSDELFVSDRNILTAKPQAHIEFAVELACRLGCVEASKAGRLKEYYRGNLQY